MNNSDILLQLGIGLAFGNVMYQGIKGVFGGKPDWELALSSSFFQAFALFLAAVVIK